jgi:hypothetical protein
MRLRKNSNNRLVIGRWKSSCFCETQDPYSKNEVRTGAHWSHRSTQKLISTMYRRTREIRASTIQRNKKLPFKEFAVI